MYLEDLINYLKQCDPDLVVKRGFGKPHSYRGDYEELAFEPTGETTVGAMLKQAESALGATFMGYKGGAYKMGPYSSTYIAPYGEGGGAQISELLLDYMTGKV